MTLDRQLHLGLLMEATGKHVASWLDPETHAEAYTDIDFYIRMAQTAERGLFDLVFASDSPGMPTENPSMLSRRAFYVARFEPVTLLSALAMATTRIGLGGTMSTTFTEPYNLARQFASLDHISRGRAAWNLVTTASDYSARNFGMSHLPDHSERYARAQEYVEAVAALWDTYEDDAFIRDREQGLYFDPAKFHPVAHQGKYFSIFGALNAARTPQGRPVIIQAGASEEGRGLASEWADLIFGHGASLDDALTFSNDVKDRAVRAGRGREDVKILSGLTLVLAETREAALAKFQALQDLVHPDIIRQTLADDLEIDLTDFPLDGRLTRDMLPERGNRHKAFFDRLAAIIEAERPTLRQLFELWASRPFCGGPRDVADMMETWFQAGAADGFMVSFQSMSGGLDLFVEQVVPELQRRGVYRTAYQGSTLRDHIGSARPRNRYAGVQ